MTAIEIINSWCYTVLRERKQNKVFPNIYLSKFEADILEITKSGYSYEYEVKISRADFKNDAAKRLKHGVRSLKTDCLKSGDRVNYFYYVVPVGLINIDDVPDLAGLIYAIDSSYTYNDFIDGKKTVKRMRFDVIKPAPKLSSKKFGIDKLNKCYESTYYRFHSQRLSTLKRVECASNCEYLISVKK